MGRHQEVGQGTSVSSQVRAVPVFNHPVDSRKLAQAVLALVLAEDQDTKTPPPTPRAKEPDHE